jgi:hypothetical protein
MKTRCYFAILVISLAAGIADGQGMFQYDQQSADEGNLLEGSLSIGSSQPTGQSFTPTLPAVDFIRLFLFDATFANTSSGTLLINLRVDSIIGPILSESESVVLAPGFGGTVNFFFSTTVPLNPGNIYYFQPVIVSGNSWGVNRSQFYNYSGGTAFGNGVASPTVDLWFREGIVVPEPSATVLVLIGSGMFLYVRRSQNRPRSKV